MASTKDNHCSYCGTAFAPEQGTQVGITGLALADNPYQTREGKPLLGTPLLEVRGRSTGSPDNAQSTFFFMWMHSTYSARMPRSFIILPDVAISVFMAAARS